MGAGAFVGREGELAELDAAVSSVMAERVVVVTGAPGVGKSRLVERWAAGREAPRADLSATRDPEDALRRIGRALSLRFGPDEPGGAAIERVGEVLASREPALLWLDDADAVIEELAPLLAAWHAVAPHARFLLTSRRAVLATPHRTLPLPPLSRDEAVELLVERARRVRPDFAVTEAQRPSVEALVDRLDALPLAIELLAPRLRLLSPARLLERLAGRTGPVDALDHALDRSFDLLQPWERDALAQCSVFRDGFYLEAAEAVVDSSAHHGAPDVLTVLESLVDQSLLRTTSVPELPDEVRLRFFGAVRERAARELDEERRHAAGQRHARYFADAGEAWDDGIESADEVEHTARLIVELPNLEAAFERSSEPHTKARLGLVLHVAHQRRGPFGRQEELVDEVRMLAQGLGDDRLLARAELAQARVQRWAGELAASEESLRRASSHAVAAGDVATEASVARNMAANCFRAGDLDGMRGHLARALEAAARSKRPSDEVNARNGLGYLFGELGRVDDAQRELETALSLARETRIPGLIALARSSLSSLMLRAERFEAAEHHATEAIASYASLGYLRQWALEHLVRAEARLGAGDLSGAGRDAAAALERARWLALRTPLVRALALRGRIAFVERSFGEAREAFEDALHRAGPSTPERARLSAWAGAARAMLGHLEPAREAFAHAAEDELSIALRGFLVLAEARDALARGQPASLAGLPEPAVGGAERRRMTEVLWSLVHELAPGREAVAVRLEVAEDGGWFRLEGGGGVDLTRRRALRAILRGLVERRVEAPGRPLSVDDVLEAGWPGERMSPDSGARRVYVTINRLRKLGLGDLLLTTGDGYMLAPRVDVVQLPPS